jgi:predicted house-cleaning noncanonical NTP pyrophosphatase (MazG superfamily)
MSVFNKLVRDRIPELIAAEGRPYEVRALRDAEFRSALEEKLIEEVAEFRAGGGTAELVDVLEVVHALARLEGVDPAELEQRRRAKAEARGGFDRRLFLVSMGEPTTGENA